LGQIGIGNDRWGFANLGSLTISLMRLLLFMVSSLLLVQQQQLQVKPMPEGCTLGDPNVIKGLPPGTILCPIGSTRQDNPSSVTVKDASPSQQSPAPPADPYDPRNDKLYRASLWFTIVGVCGGLIGLGILLWQTHLTRVAANAARDSVTGLLNSERAWILEKPKWMAGAVLISRIEYEDGNAGTELNATLVLTNCGGSPAWIIEKHITLVVADALPPVPDFNESQSKGVLHPIASGQQYEWNFALTAPGWKEVDFNQSNNKIFMYGKIKYRDAFSDAGDGNPILRETRFGYEIPNWDTFERLPDHEYNEFR
jgi:hypothetical protein